jgi:hypothetical protein
MKIELALLTDKDKGKYTKMPFDPTATNDEILQDCLKPMLETLRKSLIDEH